MINSTLRILMTLYCNKHQTSVLRIFGTKKFRRLVCFRFQDIVQNTGWFKKMDSISYVYISWTMHGMWMIYITFERGGPKVSNTTARPLAHRTAVQQHQLRSKWLLGSTSFCLYADSLFAQIGDSNDKCSSLLEVECWNEDETHAVQQSPTKF